MFRKNSLRLLLLSLFALQLRAEEPAIPADFPITPAERTRLERDKILVSRTELKQTFSAYLGDGLPQFITSDAVLNAYHVLFEETVRLQEIGNNALFREYFPKLLQHLAGVDQSYQGDKKLFAAAKQRAQFVIGVVVRLLGLETPDLPDALQTAIKAEVELIEKASGQQKPTLLGAPEPDFLGFDYSGFKPVGFYTQSPTLQRHFRAVRWLQLVPFRPDHDEELLAFYMMCTAFQPATDVSETDRLKALRKFRPLELNFWNSSNAFQRFGLSASDASLADFLSGFYPPHDWIIDRNFFKEAADKLKGKSSQSHAQFLSIDRLRSTLPSDSESEVRILSAINLPEDKALRTSSKVASTAGYPAGLEFASWLDLPLANNLLAASPRKDRKPLLDAAWPDFYTHTKTGKEAGPSWEQISEHDGLCWQQMSNLRALWDLDDRVPAFMRKEAWQRKTLMTIGSSWAQHRHTWSLQAKDDFRAMGIPQFSPAFVEPIPQFYERLAILAGKIEDIASQAEDMQSPVEAILESIHDVKKAFEAEHFQAYDEFLGLAELLDIEAPDSNEDEALLSRACLEVLNREQKLIEANDPARLKSLTLHKDHVIPRSSPKWQTFQIMCYRLALLSQQQLAQRKFAERDTEWLKYLGRQLASLMLYDNSACESPKDDAPRIAKISTDPVAHQVLQVAIGRPRVMYVLYPWQGKEILCQGAVLPYHEVSTAEPLTDAEWQERFQGKTRPPVPEWLKDFVPVDDVGLAEK